MNCPVCSTELNAVDRQGVEIDFCPRCRGVWLDRGELEKLIDRSSHTGRHDDDDSGEYPAYGRHPNQPAHQGSHPKKRESFLGRLFDFD